MALAATRRRVERSRKEATGMGKMARGGAFQWKLLLLQKYFKMSLGDNIMKLLSKNTCALHKKDAVRAKWCE
jgi:hypothetical protein